MTSAPRSVARTTSGACAPPPISAIARPGIGVLSRQVAVTLLKKETPCSVRVAIHHGANGTACRTRRPPVSRLLQDRFAASKRHACAVAASNKWIVGVSRYGATASTGLSASGARPRASIVPSACCRVTCSPAGVRVASTRSAPSIASASARAAIGGRAVQPAPLAPKSIWKSAFSPAVRDPASTTRFPSCAQAFRSNSGMAYRCQLLPDCRWMAVTCGCAPHGPSHTAMTLPPSGPAAIAIRSAGTGIRSISDHDGCPWAPAEPAPRMPPRHSSAAIAWKSRVTFLRIPSPK